MIRNVPVISLAALLCCGAGAQPAAEAPAFEVASVKPAVPPENFNQPWTSWMYGGPGSIAPALIDYHAVTLVNLIARAYGLRAWQVSGPDWIRSEKYDIAARLPPGTTKEQFRPMLANLLAKRFKIEFHREKKVAQTYSLTVAKGGSKLKPHVETAAAAEPEKPGPAERLKKNPDGFPILTGKTGLASAAGKCTWRMENASLEDLAGIITTELKVPVSDDTGLPGGYDMELRWVTRNFLSNQPHDPPDVFAAVRGQLGLNLEKKKGPAEILVIDHAEKVPTPN